MKKIHTVTAKILLLFTIGFSVQAQMNEDSVYIDGLWISDNGNGTYTNPILFADYSDPDLIKVGEDFYMVSSSFNVAPGLPVLHSKDLVNWELIGHVFQEQKPDSVYKKPGHGVGVWAPSLRYHEDTFYVYYADPDFGIYVCKAADPAGPWEYKLLHEAYGWIDPCPFWDDDGKAYLVHAYAKSRTGFNSILTLRKMSADGETLYPADSVMIFDGNLPEHPRPTLEGPKMYKRNGYYYIFAPFGGVAGGKQAVFRSETLEGPYQDSTILEQGSTDINGPHQGGWVELESGESWFIHFQEKLPYGRILHLQPMSWIDDWPFIGEDYDGNGIGEPVNVYSKPDVGETYPISFIPSSDKFNSEKLGLQWQWHSNFNESWYSLTEIPGNIQLKAVNAPEDYKNLWSVGSLFLQKPSSKDFSVTTKVDLHLNEGEYAGLIAMGESYYYLKALQTDSGIVLSQIRCSSAESGREESVVSNSTVHISDSMLFMRMAFRDRGKTAFGYSTDGKEFTALGTAYLASEGKWIGAKIGMFCLKPPESTSEGNGYASFDWFSVAPVYTSLATKPKLIEPAVGTMVEAGRRLKLEWKGDGLLADSFLVYVGTHVDSMELLKIQDRDRYYLTGTGHGLTYYWRIDTKNVLGITKGDIWNFRTTWADDIQKVNNGLSINGPYPNPMNEKAVLEFELQKPMRISYSVVDLSGRTVIQKDMNGRNAGTFKVEINRTELNTGSYIIKINAGGSRNTRHLEVF